MSDHGDFIPDVEPKGFALPAQRNPYGGNGQLAPAPQQSSSLASVEEARAIGELKAEIMLAQMYPRNEQQCTEAVLNDCGRLSLADGATFSFPRGGENISGPSIKLLEAIARRWRNLNSGWKVIYQDDERSEVVAYCWDKETNERDEVRFPVPHYRVTRTGKTKLTDPRDIYEAVANVAQRRKRACMQHIIPAEVIAAAVAACQRTVAANVDISIEGLKKLLAAFGEFGVTQRQIETRLKCQISAISPGQYLQLREIYAALKEGLDRPSTWFAEVETQAPYSPYPPQERGQRPDPQNPPDPVPAPPREPPQEPPQPPTPAPQPEPPQEPETPGTPPAAAREADEPHFDGNGGNGETEIAFEYLLLNEHGEPIADGEVFLDPLAFAMAFMAVWRASDHNRAIALIEQNRDGLEDARKLDPQADALLDGLEAMPAGDAESAEGSERPAVKPEGAKEPERAGVPESAATDEPDNGETQRANRMIVHASSLTTPEALIAYSKTPEVMDAINQWKADGRDGLVGRVRTFFTKHLDELKKHAVR